MRLRAAPTEFTKHGWNYRQIFREGDVAVYEQSKPTVSKRPAAWEVHLIKRAKPHPMDKGGWDEVEQLASDEEWGTRGFTMMTKDAALALADRLRGKGKVL